MIRWLLKLKLKNLLLYIFFIAKFLIYLYNNFKEMNPPNPSFLRKMLNLYLIYINSLLMSLERKLIYIGFMMVYDFRKKNL